MPLTGLRSHKSLWLIGILIILLTAGAAGCAPAVPDASPTSENLLETLVAEAVETQRVEGQQESDRLNATLTAAAEQPAVLAAQTLTPTITPTPKATNTPLPEVLDGKRVFLVEDTIVRSTTMKALISQLRERGKAKEIHVRVACPLRHALHRIRDDRAQPGLSRGPRRTMGTVAPALCFCRRNGGDDHP